jgi:site-specific DNA-methyltransferase (adenine-specific)
MFRVISRMELLNAGQICSQSYLTICPQDTEQQAKNVYDYLRTKFVRFLIQLTLTGMNMSIDNFRFVPWLDFNEHWDDKKLYERYNLNKEEISVIESVIREMN